MLNRAAFHAVREKLVIVLEGHTQFDSIRQTFDRLKAVEYDDEHPVIAYKKLYENLKSVEKIPVPQKISFFSGQVVFANIAIQEAKKYIDNQHGLAIFKHGCKELGILLPNVNVITEKEKTKEEENQQHATATCSQESSYYSYYTK